jgi:hypothetical protein
MAKVKATTANADHFFLLYNVLDS